MSNDKKNILDYDPNDETDTRNYIVRKDPEKTAWSVKLFVAAFFIIPPILMFTINLTTGVIAFYLFIIAIFFGKKILVAIKNKLNTMDIE